MTEIPNSMLRNTIGTEPGVKHAKLPVVLTWLQSTVYKSDIPQNIVATNNNIEIIEWMLKNTSWIMYADIVHMLYKNAAIDGDLDVIKRMRDVVGEITDDVPFTAARHGHKHIIEWFISIGYEITHLIFAKAAKGGQFKLLKWLRNRTSRQQCTWCVLTFRMAAKHGDITILKWLRAEKCPIDSTAILYAIETGKLDAVKWMYSIGMRAPEDAWNVAADFGQLEVLNWLHKINYPRTGKEYAVAARSGQITVIKWLMKNKISIGADICVHAAAGGHLKLIKWLRGKNYPWGEQVCAEAVDSGHIDVLIWARENGCPCDHGYCMLAATSAALRMQHCDKWNRRYINAQNGLKILQYFHSTGYVIFNPELCTNAAQIGDLEMLKWLRCNGYPWIIWDCLSAANGHDDVIKWIRGSIAHRRATGKRGGMHIDDANAPIIVN